jgi:predicted amidohydrolase
MDKLTIAAAQSVSIRGDVTGNLEGHYRLIEQASSRGVDVIVFPELSITGYEPDLAEELAFSDDDDRLCGLKQLSAKYNMIVIAGAPIRLETGLHIGAFVLFPDGKSLIYTKHYLHTGEEKYFVPGELNPIINVGGESIHLAICYDTCVPQHPEDAAKNGCTLYIAGVMLPLRAIDTDTNMLKEYAKKYSMTIVMSNHGGDSGGYVTGARSVIISNEGKIG